MSYRKRHIKNKIHKIKPKKSIFKRLWFWILFLSLAIILFVFYIVFFYSGLQIENIIISGNNKIKTQDLQKLASENSNTSLIKFWNINIASKSIFLASENSLGKEILEKFSAIEKTEITKKFPRTILINIIEKKPIGAFCGDNNQCFLIDQAGIIFELLSSIPENITIIKKSEEGGQIFVGKKVLSQSIIDYIYKIKKNLKDNFLIDLKEAFVASSARLNIITSENWQIYFNLDQNYDVSSQITKLNLLLKDEISEENRKRLEYIDLRPKDRAIICDNKTCGK